VATLEQVSMGRQAIRLAIQLRQNIRVNYVRYKDFVGARRNAKDLLKDVHEDANNYLRIAGWVTDALADPVRRENLLAGLSSQGVTDVAEFEASIQELIVAANDQLGANQDNIVQVADKGLADLVEYDVVF